MLNLSDIRFTGPAFPEPFVRFELEKELKDLLPKATGDVGRVLTESWDAYRRQLRELVSQGGPIRVRSTVIEPLVQRLGYEQIETAPEVATREGQESGGCLLVNGADRLRVWTTALGEDLDAPVKRGHAYRYSHLRIAQRVLLATNERVGLLTNGVDLRILISDPARTDSQIEIPVESHWKRSRDVPDSYRLVLAICSPAGLKALPDLIEKARLKQTGVTKELRKQARQAVELFVQGLLSDPANREVLREYGFSLSDFGSKGGIRPQIPNPQSQIADLSAQLWHEGLINIFRLLFVLKMEAIDDPARAFSFASSSLWRNTYSPTVALGPVVRAVVDQGAETGRFLETSLRALYRMFTEGLACTEINVKPLGGALFGENATPLISRLHWSERCVADLLDGLLWTPKARGSDARERVHYGPLTVQDLGRVYESPWPVLSGLPSSNRTPRFSPAPNGGGCAGWIWLRPGIRNPIRRPSRTASVPNVPCAMMPSDRFVRAASTPNRARTTRPLPTAASWRGGTKARSLAKKTGFPAGIPCGFTRKGTVRSLDAGVWTAVGRWLFIGMRRFSGSTKGGHQRPPSWRRGCRLCMRRAKGFCCAGHAEACWTLRARRPRPAAVSRLNVPRTTRTVIGRTA
jgi:hypothetical protein